MAKRPNILLIGHDADLVTRKTFAALAQKGMNILLAKADNDSTDSQGIDTVVMPAIHSKFNRKAITALRRIIRQNNIDAIFCASTSALSNALFANIGTKAKVIGYRGTQAKVRRLDPTYYIALLNPRVSHIVCETADIEQYLRHYISADRLSTCPKPYMREWVTEAAENPKRPDISDDTLTISYVGITKGRPHKGLHFLVSAMKILNGRGVKCHLTVVGEAGDADISAAPENVTFTGNRPDAVSYIAGSRLFVLPSLRDASPRVVREAQACGVPCIVSDIPGARDLILTGPEDESGILVPPGDPAAIADAIQTLAADRPRYDRMKANATANIDNNYNFDRYVGFFADTIKGILQ